jgi:hypothetical protein
MGKLTAILRVAERAGTALPRIRHALWVTETGYNTRPPNPGGIPLAEDARWVEQTLQLLSRQGVSLVTWDTVADQPPVPSYGETSQSGVYFLDGRPKPALAAFRFPLTAWRSGPGRVVVWGRAPGDGRVNIEQLLHGRWADVASLAVHMGDTFTTQLMHNGPMTLRSVQGSVTSIAWYQR